MMKQDLWPLPTTAARGIEKVSLYREYIRKVFREGGLKPPSDEELRGPLLLGLEEISPGLSTYYIHDPAIFSELAEQGIEMIKPSDVYGPDTAMDALYPIPFMVAWAFNVGALNAENIQREAGHTLSQDDFIKAFYAGLGFISPDALDCLKRDKDIFVALRRMGQPFISHTALCN